MESHFRPTEQALAFEEVEEETRGAVLGATYQPQVASLVQVQLPLEFGGSRSVFVLGPVQHRKSPYARLLELEFFVAVPDIEGPIFPRLQVELREMLVGRLQVLVRFGMLYSTVEQIQHFRALRFVYETVPVHQRA